MKIINTIVLGLNIIMYVKMLFAYIEAMKSNYKWYKFSDEESKTKRQIKLNLKKMGIEKKQIILKAIKDTTLIIAVTILEAIYILNFQILHI